MDVQPGLVTTILPVYNRVQMLLEAVESVLSQTYRPIELLIIDDGSTDETGRVCDELAAKHSAVRVIHQPNTGPGRAREAGRRAARGEFIQHLDSDDRLYPRKFEIQVAGLREHPECDVSYGWTRAQLPDGSRRTTPEGRTGEKIDTMFPAMLKSRWWHTPTPLYRVSLIQRAGPWLELKNEEDWEYDARVASFGVRLHYCPAWIAEVRHHHEGRLSDRGQDRAGLRDRARAHAFILGHAWRAGIGYEVPEMQHFARELFLLARQCGAAGLPEESRTLFDLARDASGPARDRLQFRTYRWIAGIFGWSLTGRMACLSDRLRW